MDSNKEILKAELEDGYARVANLLLEALSASQLNGKQMSICIFIIRRTYSWGEKSDEITLKEFALACNSSETYMSKQLKQLIEWKVIKRNNYSPGKVPEYEINTRVDEWDKGCLNVQGLNESTSQGLYKRTRVPLNKKTRVVMPLDIENTRIEGSLKESSKEITTTISIESEVEAKEIKSSVADIGADPIQQNEETEQRDLDLQRIEDYYKREIRRKIVISSNDTVNITRTYEKYKDVDFIISVMKKAKEDYINRYGKLEINSFSYFDSIFEERWKALHSKDDVKASGVVSAPKNYNYSSNKYKAKKTRFHNFEQRSDKYTADQLEDVAARKRKEYMEKLKNQNEAL